MTGPSGGDRVTAHLCATPECRRSVRDAFVCPECGAELVRALTEHPHTAVRGGSTTTGAAALVADLADAIDRSSRLAAGSGAQSGETPLCWNEGAAEALWVLSSTLGTWVQALCEDRGVPLPFTLIDVSVWPRGWVRVALPAAQAVTAGAFLVRHAEAVRQSEGGGQLVDEVTAAVAQARRAIDRPQSAEFLGRCYACSTSVTPGPELLAAPGAAEVICPGCAAAYPVAMLRERMERTMRAHLGTASEIAGLLGAQLGIPVTVQRISMWKSRGLAGRRLLTRGTNPAGHDLLLVGDVIDMARSSAPRRTDH